MKRWIVLGLATIVQFGPYYAYDQISPLHDILERYFQNDEDGGSRTTSVGSSDNSTSAGQVSQQQEDDFELFFNMLYTVYSLPNIFLPLVAGYFVDIVGAAKISIALSIVIMIGQILLTVGLMLESTTWMLIGRTFFGFGGEGLCVAQSAIIAHWFEGKELAFAMGLQLSVARGGSVLAFTTTPELVEKYGLCFPFWCGVCLIFVGVICSVALTIIESVGGGPKSSTTIATMDVTTDEEVGKGDAEHRYHAHEAVADKKRSMMRKCRDRDPARATEVYKAEDVTQSKVGDTAATGDEHVDLFCGAKSLSNAFVVAFWLITFNCILTYGAIYPFNSIGSALLIEKFLCPGDHGCCDSIDIDTCKLQSDADQSAGQLMSLPLAISGLLSPIFGGCVDLIGHKSILILVSSVLLCCSHAWIYLSYEGSDPSGPLVLLGIGFALYAAVLWPCIPCVVHKDQCGTAFGVVNCLQNLGLSLWPIIVVIIRKHSDHYIGVEVFFSTLAFTGICTTVALIVTDLRGMGGRLTRGRLCAAENLDDGDDESKEALLGRRKKSDAVTIRGTINSGSIGTDSAGGGLSVNRIVHEETGVEAIVVSPSSARATDFFGDTTLTRRRLFHPPASGDAGS
eukprot:g4436.t1